MIKEFKNNIQALEQWHAQKCDPANFHGFKFKLKLIIYNT